jgi:hypothetical protein
MRLLAERDNNRPVWRIYRPAVVVKEKKYEIVDATRHSVPVATEPIHGIPDPTHRIDVGDDAEIADILNDEDNVTV